MIHADCAASDLAEAVGRVLAVMAGSSSVCSLGAPRVNIEEGKTRHDVPVMEAIAIIRADLTPQTLVTAGFGAPLPLGRVVPVSLTAYGSENMKRYAQQTRLTITVNSNYLRSDSSRRDLRNNFDAFVLGAVGLNAAACDVDDTPVTFAVGAFEGGLPTLSQACAVFGDIERIASMMLVKSASAAEIAAAMEGAASPDDKRGTRVKRLGDAWLLTSHPERTLAAFFDDVRARLASS